MGTADLKGYGMTKQFAYIILSLLAVLLLLLGYILFEDAKNKKLFLKWNESYAVEAVSSNLDRELDEVISDLKFLASDVRLQRVLLGDEPSCINLICDEIFRFIKERDEYDQIRLLSLSGKELIRVNLAGGSPYVVAKKDLQDKASRYYFQQGAKLKSGEVYISRLDLNMDGGKVEKPWKPVIRFVTAIYNKGGKQLGMVVLNYLAEEMLSESKHDGTNVSIINSDGYLLAGVASDENFSFMLGEGQGSFAENNPEVWSKISQDGSGQFLTDVGLYSYVTVHPVKKLGLAIKTSGQGSYEWKVISFLSAKAFKGVDAGAMHKGAIIFFTLLFIMGFGVWKVWDMTKLGKQSRWQTVSPVVMLFIMAASIAVVVTLSMFIIHPMPSMPMFFESALDSLVLVVLLLPMFYFFLFRPMFQQIDRVQKTDREKNILAAAIEQTHEMVLISDINQNVAYMNSAFEETTGYKLADLLGSPINQAFGSGILKEQYIAISHELNSGRAWSGIVSGVYKDGSRHELFASVSPVLGENGEVINSVSSMKDITHERSLERAKEFFTSVTSHELRTPLVKIKLLEMLIGKMADGSASKDDIEKAEDAIERVYRSIDRIVESTSIYSDVVSGMSSNLEKINLSKLIKYCVGMTVDGLKQAGRDVSIKVDVDSLPDVCLINGNIKMLEKVFEELMSNGVKYTADGGCLSIFGKKDGGIFIINIRDEGIGIPEEYMDKIFNPYFSLENVLEHSSGEYAFKGGGIGLGLTLAKMVMEHHGGSIAVSIPEQGRGTLVTLNFPCRKN